MTAQEKVQAINEMLVLWQSGELSSYDFAVAVERVMSA